MRRCLSFPVLEPQDYTTRVAEIGLDLPGGTQFRKLRSTHVDFDRPDREIGLYPNVYTSTRAVSQLGLRFCTGEKVRSVVENSDEDLPEGSVTPKMSVTEPRPKEIRDFVARNIQADRIRGLRARLVVSSFGHTADPFIEIVSDLAGGSVHTEISQPGISRTH